MAPAATGKAGQNVGRKPLRTPRRDSARHELLRHIVAAMTDYDVHGTHTHTTSEPVQVFLEITAPHPDPTLHRRLGSLTGLVHLHHEAW